ncbi:MAG: hypothetical protein V3T58_06010 [Candidatus Hydrothermarchaeales archaeon]
MNIKTIETLLREVQTRYDKDPKGWNFVVGPGEKYFDIMISKGAKVWQLKLDTLYKPNPVGFGSLIDKREVPALDISGPSFGYRPLSDEQIEALLTQSLDLEEIIEIEPMSLNKIKSPIVAQGPILHTSKPMNYVSEKQKALDLKLRRKIDDLLEKSGVTTSYV